MAKILLLVSWLGGGWLAQQSPAPDVSPLAYWGVAGILLTFILWLYLDERKEHKALRQKVLDDILPALIANNEQLRDSSSAVIQVHQIAGRPNLDPILFNEWVRTMRDVKEVLEEVRKARPR